LLLLVCFNSCFLKVFRLIFALTLSTFLFKSI
jgi:hypothetical protein